MIRERQRERQSRFFSLKVKYITSSRDAKAIGFSVIIDEVLMSIISLSVVIFMCQLSQFRSSIGSQEPMELSIYIYMYLYKYLYKYNIIDVSY